MLTTRPQLENSQFNNCDFKLKMGKKEHDFLPGFLDMQYIFKGFSGMTSKLSQCVFYLCINATVKINCRSYPWGSIEKPPKEFSRYFTWLLLRISLLEMTCDPFFLDSTDRHWVGMWWGGFLICGLSLIFISFPFFFFPKELKVRI